MFHEPPTALGVLTAAEQRQLRDLLAKLTAADPELTARARESWVS